MPWSNPKAKPVRYVLEVMPPGVSAAWPRPDDSGPLLRVEATTPFQAIQAGDELLPRDFTLQEEQQGALSKLVLRVVKVRRCIAKSYGLIDDHVILFTEDVRRAEARSHRGNPEMN